MKTLFFLLFFFISFTATAQIPKPGRNGYKEYIAYRKSDGFEISNNRNEFWESYEGQVISSIQFEDHIDSAGIIKYVFQNHKCFYNGRYYYSNYKEKGKYCYRIFLFDVEINLGVCSVYNDSEYIQCKHMLDKQARVVMRKGYCE